MIFQRKCEEYSRLFLFNPLSANATKWSNTLKQFVGKLPTGCLSVFDHFVKLALKRLTLISWVLGQLPPRKIETLTHVLSCEYCEIF